jgi:hypothetical protein
MTGAAAHPLTPVRARKLTLRWANRVRAGHQLGAPLAGLPAGWGGSCGCPIAVALSDLEAGRQAHVGMTHARILAGGSNARDDVRLELPWAAQVFIALFDEGVYPDLLRGR